MQECREVDAADSYLFVHFVDALAVGGLKMTGSYLVYLRDTQRCA